MKVIRSLDEDSYAQIGWNARVLLVTGEDESGPTARKLAGLGGKVDVVQEMYSALSELLDDPSGYALFVVDCDTAGVGGLQAAQAGIRMLGEAAQRLPVILVSSECSQQRFPMDRGAPTVLRAPLSAVSLKVGYEHALRDRLLYQAA